MNASAAPALDRWIQGPGRRGLFLDYDGTLSNFSEKVDWIAPDPDLIDLLTSLSKKKDLDIAVISGRTLNDLIRLLPVRSVSLAGSYGIELRLSSGENIRRVDFDNIRPALNRVMPEWKRLIEGQPGCQLQDKGWSLAIHTWRDTNEAILETLVQAQRIALRVIEPGQFRLFTSSTYLELAPIQANKGEAVAFLLSRFQQSPMQLIYFGDDDKDEEGFRAVHARGGVAVQVSHASGPPVVTSADTIMESPNQVRNWLRNFSVDAGGLP